MTDGLDLQTMLITRSNYERIYRVVNSIVVNEGANPSVACIFFAGLGAYILESHFGFDANPRAGLAAYHLGGSDVLIFGQETSGGFTGEADNFHCWVEANGWAIDFMAPAFSQLNSRIPPRMFQRPLSTMTSSIDELATPGDFFLSATPQSTAKHMSVLTTRQAYGDMAEIAAKWFKKDPRKMLASITIGDQNGIMKKVPLAGLPLKGTW